MKNSVQLYALTTSGDIKTLIFETSGSKFITHHGRLDGKMQTTFKVCEAKNVGRGNELTAAEQAIAEMNAKITKKMKEGYSKTRIARQSLLFPETMEMGHQEAKVLKKHQGELKELGMELEHFGGNTFIIKAVPELLSKANYRELIRDVIEELSNDLKSRKLEEKIDEILILMACHSAVRANQPLTEREIESLLQSLDEVEYSSNCPHGRPVIKEISFKELEKMFKRR